MDATSRRNAGESHAETPGTGSHAETQRPQRKCCLRCFSLRALRLCVRLSPAPRREAIAFIRAARRRRHARRAPRRDPRGDAEAAEKMLFALLLSACSAPLREVISCASA